jgi:hypothetical protein
VEPEIHVVVQIDAIILRRIFLHKVREHNVSHGRGSCRKLLRRIFLHKVREHNVSHGRGSCRKLNRNMFPICILEADVLRCIKLHLCSWENENYEIAQTNRHTLYFLKQ